MNNYCGVDDPIWQAPMGRVKECYEACEGLNPSEIKPLIEVCEQYCKDMGCTNTCSAPICDALKKIKC